MESNPTRLALGHGAGAFLGRVTRLCSLSTAPAKQREEAGLIRAARLVNLLMLLVFALGHRENIT